MADTLIALGANLGDKSEALEEAIERLAESPGVKLVAGSKILQTHPIGVPDSDEIFLNAAARFCVELSPQQWLERLLETEQQLGRQRTVRWGARKIDLDLLLYDDQTIDSAPLVVPHPRMVFRRFVMQPAVEVAGDMIHPTYGRTVGQLWAFLDEAPNWIVWQGPPQGQLDLFERLRFHVTVHRWMVADETGFDNRLDSLQEKMSSAPIVGDAAEAVLIGVPDLESMKALGERLNQRGIEVKLEIKVRSAAENATRLADISMPNPCLQLVLESNHEERVVQEVTGAIESMLVL